MFSWRSGMRFPYCLKDYLDPRHWTRRIRWSYQRATRGWCDADLWSFDYHIAYVLADALPNLKNNTEHTAYVMMTKGEDMFSIMTRPLSISDDDDREAADNEFCNEWDAYVDSIVQRLHAYIADPETEEDVRAWYDSKSKQHFDAQQAIRDFGDQFGRFWA